MKYTKVFRILILTKFKILTTHVIVIVDKIAKIFFIDSKLFYFICMYMLWLCLNFLKN